MLEGGFPTGSIILVAGGPGTGKTVFASQFIYNGAAKYGEKGIYVSFNEGAESFKQYMQTLGWEYRRLETQRMVQILDMATLKKETLETTLRLILEKVRSFEAERLVLDSITALTMTLENRHEVRVLTSFMEKYLKNMDCTTIMVAETHGVTQPSELT